MSPDSKINIWKILLVVLVSLFMFFALSGTSKNNQADLIDDLFGWKFPVAKFPEVGTSDKLAYSNIRDSKALPEGLPVRLKIPITGVDSAIEDALILPNGRMDVPAGSKNVAWFALGPKPGNVGSAVIAGHYGIKDGVPFIFYKLDKMKVGDKIYVENDKGETLAFQVRSIKLFNRDDDATTVFTSDDGLAHLNLITCEGIWNRVNDTYPERRVVFADAIPREGSVVVSVEPKVTKKATTPTATPLQKTKLPSTDFVAPASVIQNNIEPTQGLSNTSTNKIITFSLIISILFVTFKILKPRKP